MVDHSLNDANTKRPPGSILEGATNSLRNEGGYSTFVGAGQLRGPVNIVGGSVVCVGCYNSNYQNANGYEFIP